MLSNIESEEHRLPVGSPASENGQKTQINPVLLFAGFVKLGSTLPTIPKKQEPTKLK
jgi:hypothetical protein